MVALMPAWGIISAVGVFQTYISEHQLEHVSLSMQSYIFSVYSFFAMGGSLVIGPFFDQYGGRSLMFIGGALMVGGLIGASFSSEVYEFILSFGFALGIGTAFIICPNVSVINHYYVKKLGLMQGISELGGSVGGVLIPLMLRRLFVQVGWGWAMRVLALFSLVCVAIGIVVVKDRTEILNRGQPKLPIHKLFFKNFDKEQLKDNTFIGLVVSVVPVEFSLLLVLTYLPSFAIAEGISESASFMMIVVFAISGLFGHIIPSLMADRYGRFNALLVVSIFMSLFTFALWLPAQYYPKKLLGLYFFTILYGFFVAGSYSLLPAVIGQFSKVEDAGKRFGLVYGFVALANLASLPIGSEILGDGDMDGYTHLIIFSGSVCSAGVLAMLAFKYKMTKDLFAVL
ncbi:unnamed protein product [Ambrosiozyma monospora]|uniref:Unnamed protein product n=1 Tax=Ambrosiozyma monospora TaxID=43982 RepID=A0ACB5TCG8_AMBMO|nr:unnamed protein product [Ambrosiozyma monospora]